MTPHKISLNKGKVFLYLPGDYDIFVAAQGMKRVRFLTKSPDNRIFVTDMYNRTDNSRGKVYILENFNANTHKFDQVIPYLTSLRNPNSVAFYKEPNGQEWFYLALTDRLLRYKYVDGETQPAGEPEVLATFPDYGLNYKYGGWHLTRTLAFGGDGKLYVSVGSSCNACIETESVRASILEMDPDGKNQRTFSSGLRNAVGIKWIGNALYATDMGADHLGDDSPEDTMYEVQRGRNYGWPYCYSYRSKMVADPAFSSSEGRVDCAQVPQSYVTFEAHSSPLGFDYFDSSAADDQLKNGFLVALHGSSKRSLGRGYRISIVRQGIAPQDFITGFIQGNRIIGRPADVMRISSDAFLFTDDYAGVVYYVTRRNKQRIR